jgi:predicted nucleic acid-binding protein
MKRFYLDTSIWLDLFENRNEPNMPKGDWAKNLMRYIVKQECELVISNVNLKELNKYGYSNQIIFQFLRKFKKRIFYIHTTKKETNRAKDIAEERKIPKGDVLHCLVAKKSGAILITFDNHFNELNDFIKVKTSNNFI